MPFQPINFAAIEPIGSPFLRNLIGTLTSGYKAGQLPAQMERQKQKEELANAFQGLKVKEEPERFSSQMLTEKLNQDMQKLLNEEQPQKFGSEMSTAAIGRALHQANIDKIREELKLPFAGNIPPGSVGQALYVNMIKGKYGENSPEYQMAKQSYEADLSHTKATVDRQQQLVNSGMFRALNADDKRRVIAYAVGMGYTPDEAAKELSNGNTLQDLSERKGVNLSDVTPNYALTTASITNLANRKAFTNEITYLESKIAEPMSKVSRKFAGYSPVQLWGAISGKMTPDEQGKILAARALQPDIAALRTRAQQGQVGIEAIREFQDKALGNLKVMESTISPEAYLAMDKYLNQWINDASSIFNRSIEKGAALGNPPSKIESLEKKATKRFNRETGDFEVIR